jgi:hypothetical protein
MPRLLAHPLPPSPVYKLSLFLSLPVCPVELTDGGVEEEQNITARKPGPLKIIQYSLSTAKEENSVNVGF